MSILSLAISNVFQEIPDEILEEAFLNQNKRNYYMPTSIDAKIIEEVIDKRVMPDLNIEYATKINIPLGKCTIERISPVDWVVTVPPEVLNERKIISVLGINYVNAFTGMGDGTVPVGSGGGALLAGAQKMANATSGMPANYETKCELISGNSFLIRRSGFLNNYCMVEMIIENDPQLNNIPITAADYIKKLVLLAVKAYIYRKLKIKIGRAQLDGGSELGPFMEFIDSYADSNELYLEELKSASRIQWLASEEMKTDYLTMIMGNNI